MSDEPKCEACGAVVGPGGALGWCALCVLREAAGLEREAERRGDYEILGEVARGGMGVVYRARQVSLNRVVALKVLLGGGFVGESGRQRLRSEAAAAARLKHPHIVAVHDAGEWEGQPYFAMEFVAGPTLSEVLRDGPLRLARAVHLVETVARAVHYAHEQGIVHRDLKPSNILLDGEDQPRVADFGLARAEAEAADATRTGTVLGSPAYMPPEQARGQVRRIGPRSDVYSLGAVLYETLTGHPPFLAESPTAVLELVKHTEPVPPRRLNASVPADLETICLRCLEKEPEGRYASAAELAEDLARFRRGEPVHARPLGPVARGLRWARREPALAMVWGLTAALALGSSAAAWWIGRERDVAVVAQRETREALLVARGAQARAVVRSERMGQRREALAAVAEAARIRVTRELRDSAIVALTRWDVQLTNEWTARARQGASWAVAPDLKSEVSETAPGVLSWRDPGTGRVRAVLDGGELGEVVNVPAFDLLSGYVAAAHARGDLAVWRLDAAPRRVLRVDVGAPGVESRRFRPYDFRPGSAELVVARPGAGLELYSLETGERVRQWPGLGVTNLVRVSPDGLGVAVTSATSLVSVVEIEGA
ncbi:MAG: serine/threonine protein kinase, partial [Verrucomicrobiales bacterium]|nr:serine/threonine protein kinase [Verrucomicrobiales bacterium]